MCRYAMVKYKPHYVCFECRKTFKRKLFSDIKSGVYHPEATCPQCKGLMAEVGMDFKAPKKESVKAWEHIRCLYSVGFTFFSCGCTGPGYIPADKEELIAHFNTIIQQYTEHLNFWRNRKEPQTKSEKDREKNVYTKYIHWIPGKKHISNQEGIDYWIGKIKEVEAKIREVKA